MTNLPFFCPTKPTNDWPYIASGVRMYPAPARRAFGMHLCAGTRYAARMAAHLGEQKEPQTAVQQWLVFQELLAKGQDVLVLGPGIPPVLPFVHGRTVVSIVAGPGFEPGPSPLLKALVEEARLVTINFAAPLVSAYGCLPSTGGFPLVIESEPCVVRPWLGYLGRVYPRAEPIIVIAGKGDAVVMPTLKAMWGEQVPTATGKPS